MKTADWYFDFISPFTYLQSERLSRFDGKLAIRPVPVLFAGLLKHWGRKGPAEMATKRRFTYRQVQCVAERNGIPFRFPPQHPFNPVRALRAAVALAIDKELFWGFDATDMALDYLADPQLFAHGEYPRIVALPVGAARKESS
jgi:2-hydroxychromene-2-carboxylate isomerase